MANQRINGAKLREIILAKGLDPRSDNDLEIFGVLIQEVSTKGKPISITTLKRWLKSRPIRLDTLTGLVELLDVPYEDLCLGDSVVIEEQEEQEDEEPHGDPPFAIDIHLYQDNAKYRKVINAIRVLLVAFGIKVVIHVTKVRRGSLILTLRINAETLIYIMHLFDQGEFGRLGVKQIDLPVSASAFIFLFCLRYLSRNFTPFDIIDDLDVLHERYVYRFSRNLDPNAFPGDNAMGTMRESDLLLWRRYPDHLEQGYLDALPFADPTLRNDAYLFCLMRCYDNLRFRPLSEGTIAARRKRLKKRSKIALHD